MAASEILNFSFIIFKKLPIEAKSLQARGEADSKYIKYRIFLTFRNVNQVLSQILLEKVCLNYKIHQLGKFTSKRKCVVRWGCF